MLSIPSTHLIVMAYSVDDKIVNFLKSINMAQVTLLTGAEFGSIDSLVKYYLPKASIDRITETASRLIENRKGYTDLKKVEDMNDNA